MSTRRKADAQQDRNLLVRLKVYSITPIKTMLSPYLPKPTKSKYPTLTEGKGMQELPTYAQSAIDASSAIDRAIVELSLIHI